MRLITAAAVAAVLGIGLLVLQRWVAETRTAAFVLVGVWFAVVAVGTVVALRRRPELRRAAFATIAAIAVASGAIGYWTGFRDKRVDESVVTADRDATATERTVALAPASAAEEEQQLAEMEEETEEPQGPVRVLTGRIAGADGHAGTGKAAIVREPSGDRRLTLTDFDVDPGPGVVVYLARDESNTDDVIDLGSLKGNVGNQQYSVPRSADLTRYDTLILWCVPFTTRIAVAPLS